MNFTVCENIPRQCWIIFFLSIFHMLSVENNLICDMSLVYFYFAAVGTCIIYEPVSGSLL